MIDSVCEVVWECLDSSLYGSGDGSVEGFIENVEWTLKKLGLDKGYEWEDVRDRFMEEDEFEDDKEKEFVIKLFNTKCS